MSDERPFEVRPPVPEWQTAVMPVQLPPPPPSLGRPPKRPQRVPAWLVVGVVTLLAVLGVAVIAAGRNLSGLAQALDGRPLNWPKAAVDAPAPLGVPAPVVGTSSDYAFISTAPDGVTPVGFNPCRPIHYVVNTTYQPAGAEIYLPRALAEVSAATGLTFVNDGTTQEQYTDRRAAFQRGRYGDRWAPVLITWTTPELTPHLTGDTLGFGGGYRADLGGEAAFVTGAVVLDAPQFVQVFSEPSGWRVAQGAIEHELGHLVGLDHVDAADELMHPTARLSVNDFGVGDRVGLHRLGQIPCTPKI